MNEILSKASRLETPRSVSVQLRKEVYDSLFRICAVNGHLPVSRVIRAIVEDFCDRLPDEASDQEVSD